MSELNEGSAKREKAAEMWEKLRKKLPKIIAMSRLN